MVAGLTAIALGVMGGVAVLDVSQAPPAAAKAVGTAGTARGSTISGGGVGAPITDTLYNGAKLTVSAPTKLESRFNQPTQTGYSAVQVGPENTTPANAPWGMVWAMPGPNNQMRPYNPVSGNEPTVTASMVNNNQHYDVMSFNVTFDPPLANPTLNMYNWGWQVGWGTNVAQAYGQLKLTGARNSSGGAASVSMDRISGFNQNGGTWSMNGNTFTSPINTATLRSYIRSDSSGTVRFDSGGQPISSLSFTSADAYWSGEGLRTVYPTNWGFQLQAPENVSALNRWVGTYDHATHLMPAAGNANLHLGNAISEGNKNSYTYATNSGSAGDNSDAGYDGLATLYFADDPAHTPVTQIYASDAGRTLETQVRVAGAESRTAYVRGFIDFGRSGSFPASGASSTPAVPNGNGTATLQWTIPSTVGSGDLPIRLRTSYDQAQITSAFGTATSGEVEDYQGRLTGSGGGSRNNLKVVKTVSSGANARPGETVTYQLWVNNTNGTATTSAVSLTDTLPTQLENVTIALPPTTGTASVSGSTLTWSIPAGVSSNIGMQVTGRVKAGSAQGSMTNTATLSGLCDGANCTSSATSSISGSPASLKIEKTGPATVTSGGSIEWKLTATNVGELATGTGVVVTDNLPTQLQYDATTASGDGTATVSGSTVVWHLPNSIAAGAQVQLTIRSRLVMALATGTTITNRATVTSGPCSGAECLAQFSSLVSDSTSKIALEQSAPSAKIYPGDTGTYTYTVRNTGATALRNIQVSDTTAIFFSDPIQCAGSGNDRIANLAAGASVTCTLRHTFTEDEFSAGHIAWQLNGLTNRGHVQGTDNDGVPVSADGSSTTKFDIHFTGSLTKSVVSVTPTPVRANSVVQYKADLAYTGDGGMMWAWFIDSRVPRGEWTCTPEVTADIPHGYTSTCRAPYTITEQDIRDNWDAGEITNNAMFSGTNTIWFNQNLTMFGRAAVPIDKSVPKVRLEGSVTVNQPTAEPGDTVTFTIKAKNTGQLTATSTEVLSSLKGASPAAIPAANCTWPAAVGTLAPNAEVTCQVPYTVTVADVNSTIIDKATARALDGTLPYGPVDLGQAEVTVGSGQNLSATKTNSLTPGAKVKPGQQFSYTITVKNDGTAPATGVTLTDQLPEGLEFFPTSQPGWTFTGRSAKSAPFDVPANGANALPLLVRVVDGTAGGTVLKNVAAIDSLATIAECTLDETKQGCAVDQFPPSVDDSNITITKSNSITSVPPQVKAGDTFTYTLQIRNTGTSPASNVTITDQLPEGLEFFPTPQSGWTFTGRTAKSLSFNLGGNASTMLYLSVRVTAGASGVLKNVSAVDGMATPAQCDADATLPGCGVDPNPPSVVDHSGVKLAKSNDVTTVGKRVKVGDTFTYTITATNTSGVRADGVLISDTLPTGLVFDGPQDTKWTISGNTATWRTDIPAGGNVQGDLKVRVVAGASGTLRNVAVMDDQKPGECDVTPIPNACGVDPDPPIVDNTNLSITKSNSVTGGVVYLGETYTYTFTVHNGGSEAATGVVITDLLQSDITFSPSPQAGWTASGQQVTSDPFDVAVGATRSLSFTVKVNSDVRGGTVIRNTGVIKDLVEPNTCTAAPTTRGCGVDPRPPTVNDSAITITKSNSLSGTPPYVKAGDMFSYTLVVRNGGTSMASNVSVSDVLPAGLEFYPTPQSLWTLTGNNAKSASFNLAGNSQLTLVLYVRVTANATGELKNVSAVDGTTPLADCAVDATLPGCGVDPNPPRVVDHSGVSIAKSNNVSTPGKKVKVGDTFTYTLTVTNASATDAQRIEVSDTLPSGLVFDGPQNTMWTITGSTAKATIDVAAGAAPTYDLRVRVAPGASGTLLNVSVLDDQNPAQCVGPNPGPKCGVDPDPPSVDNTSVTIAKSHVLGAGARVKPGQSYDYTFTVRNSGTEPASGIVVRDTLPDSLEMFPVTQPGWTMTGGTLVSAPLTVGPNGTTTLTLSVRVKSTATGGTVIRNIGVVDGMATPDECALTPTKPGCGVDPQPPTVDDSNITITKRNNVTGTPKLVKAGQTFSYTLEVRNTGLTTASNIQITDQLPAGLEFSPTVQSGWTITGNTAKSASFNLVGYGLNVLTLTVRVQPNAVGELRNVSAVEGMATPGECAITPTDPGCGVDPDPPSVPDHSRISIAKANDVSTVDKKVRIGDVFHYAIAVTNPTTEIVRSVELYDTLPAGLVLNGTQAAPWVVSGTNRVSAVVDVPANSTQTYDIYVRVAEGASGTLRNVAVMDDRTPTECLATPSLHGCAVDPQPPVVVAALVKLTKTNDVIDDMNKFVKPGETYNYTITAKNEGTVPALGVTVSDTLPAALEFPTGPQSGWTISGSTAQSISFDLAPGASRIFTLTVRVKLSATTGTYVRNAVVQDGGPTPASCIATPTLAGCGVDPKPPIVNADIIDAHKDSSVPPGMAAKVGEAVKYTITVTNTGYRDAENVVVNDLLPEGLTFDPPVQAGWRFEGSNAFSDPFNLRAGESRELTLLTVATKPQTEPTRNVVVPYSYTLAAIPGGSGFAARAAAPNAAVSEAVPAQVIAGGPTVYECQKDATQDGCAYADVLIVPNPSASATPSPAPGAATTASATPTASATSKSSVSTLFSSISAALKRLFGR